MRKSCLAVLLAAACVLPVHADVTVSGVKYEARADVRGAKLQLNGAGTRHKGPFKVYAAALYLPKKAGSADEALAAPGAKRVAVTMLRDIDAGELGRLFTRGVEDNMDKAAFSKLIPGLMRMSTIFGEQKRLQAGDSFTLDWVPGVGTVVNVRGVPQGEPFREPEFFNALLRIWLGPAPADWQLKEQLLGQPVRGNGAG
ncbi:MAG TPA: chalcone isomerase family protein [Ramlibacter sp.]|jgi:hypothetical protein|nr:chalcone isomerase family protein [Ramlibacter sp.]